MSKAIDLISMCEEFSRREMDDITVRDMIDTSSVTVKPSEHDIIVEVGMTSLNWSVSNIDDLADYLKDIGYGPNQVIGNGKVIRFSIPRENKAVLQKMVLNLGFSALSDYTK